MIIKILSCTVIYSTHLVTTQKNIYINKSSVTQLVFKSTRSKYLMLSNVECGTDIWSFP